MANEFKVRKGLIVNGSGSTLLDVQGSQGQLFAITDSLSGSLFTVSDISGIPIFEVRSDDTIKLGTFNAEAIIVSGSHATVSGSFSGSFQGDGSGLTNINVDNIANVVDGSGGANQIAFWSDTDTITGDANFFYNSAQDTLNINKVAVGDVTSENFFRIKFTDFGGVANDVGIGLPATGALGFNIRNGDYFQWNNGSAGEIMRLNSTGLGIGTTPGASLHVASTTSDFVAKFSHTTATGYAPGSILLQAGQGTSRGQGLFHYNTEADESWFTGVPYNVTSRKWIVAHKPDTTFNPDVAQLSHAILTIDSATDNIGIGESSPTSKLHIKGTGNEQIFITGSTARVQIKGASQSLHIYSWASGVNIYNGTSDSIYFGRDASTSNKFYFYDSSGVQTMLVNTATGNVGIGNATPTQKLEVRSGDILISGSNPRIMFEHQNESFVHDLMLKDVNNGQLHYRYGGGTKIYFDNHSIVFGDYDGGAGTLATTQDPRISKSGTGSTLGSLQFITNNSTRMFISSSGNIGINTTVPGTRLHIVEAGGSAQLTLERTGGSAGKAVLAGAAEGFIVYDDVYGAKMYVGTAGTYNGRVGIGTITPDEKLHVAGNIKVTGELNNGTYNSIDLDDHSGYTWFRNDNNSWAFQGGSSGDDWTQAVRLTLETVDSSYNNKWLVLGQQNSNQTEGKYKGVRIVKYNSGTIDGDLQAGTATFTGDLTVQGIVTAREFHTEFVSASIIYMSGSTKFGDTNDDNHNFTGSINVLSGSLNITGPSADPGTPLTLHNSTNAAGVGIRFTDVAAGTSQYGRIVYRHSDASSQGGGASFHFTGEPDLTLILGDATNKGRFVVSSANTAAEVDYGFYGDVNTGMYQPSLNALGLVSNGSEKIRVNTNGAEIKNGNLYIPEYLYHVGDTDTYMRFLGDEIQFHAGGIKLLDISEAGSTVIINQDSNDIDFRVEGNTDANLLFTDAGNDRVGIGTSTPSEKLEVTGNIQLSGNIIDSASPLYYVDLNGTSKLNHLYLYSTLSFGSYNAGVRGTIFEGYSTNSVMRTDSDRLDFYMGKSTSGVGTMMSLTYDGKVGIGTSAPATKLHVSGTADVLRVEGSGSTLFDIQGSQGQLFSVTDSLSGSLFAIGDISGIPILEVFSDTSVNIGTYGAEAIKVSGSNATVTGSFTGSFTGDGSGLTGVSVTGFVDGTGAANKVAIWSDADTLTTGGLEFNTSNSVLSVTGIINKISDPDTNITFGGSDNIRFVAGGSERFSINTTTVTSNVDLYVGSTSTAGNRSLKVMTNDSNIASIEAYGNSQGTGKIYVGQAANYGGGILYNGDDNPDIPQTSDAISFYRRDNNTETEVFRYPYNSNTVTFVGDIVVSGGDITLGGTGRIQGIDTVTANTDAANKLYVDNAVASISDADTVDGLHAASFLRSDAADTATGLITFTNTAAFRTIDLQSTSPAVYFNDTDVTQGYHIGQNGDQFWILRDSDGNGAYNSILAHWNNNETKVYGNLIIGGDDNVFGVAGSVNEYWLNGSSTEGNTKILTHHDNAIELHASDVIDFMSGSSDTSFRFNNNTSQMSIGFTTFNEALNVSGSISASGDLSVGNGNIGRVFTPGNVGKLVLSTQGGGAVYIGESALSGSDLVHYSNVDSTFTTYGWSSGIYDIDTSTNLLRLKTAVGTEVYGGEFAVKPILYSANQTAYALRMGAYNNSSWDNWGIQAKSTATGAPYTSIRVPALDNAITIVNSPAGYVGINTAAPSARLHVNGGASGAVAFKVTPGNAGKEWSIDASNPDHLKKEENIVLSADPGNVHANTTIGFQIDGSTKAQLTSDGRLGINKTSPEVELDVNGTIYGILRRKPQMETAAGGNGVNDGANTWAKLITFDISAASYNDLVAKYSFSDSESSNAGGYAEFVVKLRKGASTALDICDLQVTQLQSVIEGGVTSFSQILHEDSFKIINNGHADIQVWVQKKQNWGRFNLYEESINFDGWPDNTYQASITYHDNAAWQSSTPSGNFNYTPNIASTRHIQQYTFFTNYNNQHRYIPLISTFPSATPNYTHKYILPKSGHLVGIQLMANASIIGLKIKTWRMDGGTPTAHGSELTINLIANTPVWIPIELNWPKQAYTTTYTSAGFSVQPPSTTGYYYNMAAVWQF